MKVKFRTSLVLLATFALFAALYAPVADAHAGQSVRITMRDGSIWRGDVNAKVDVTYQYRYGELEVTGKLVEVHDLYIKIQPTDGPEKTLFRRDLISMTSADDAAPAGDKPHESADASNPVKNKPGAQPADAQRPADSNLPHVFLLPLKGTVGVEFRHEEIDAIGKEADKYGDGQIIVLEIDSGGGLVTEMEQIHKSLTEIGKHHRLVGWIKHATSAACATAIHCPELYFMTEGRAGAMTAFNAAGAAKGAELQDWLRNAGDWMEQGGRPRIIVYAMIDANRELSYDKDPVTGKVTWYPTTQGAHVLSRKGENLEFNSSNAVDSGFSQGLADTTDQLAKLLDLPYWYESSDYGREIAQDWQDTVERANREVPLILARLAYKNTSGTPQVVIGSKIKYLKELVSWWHRAPNVMRSLGIPSEEALKQQIEQLRRQLAGSR